MPGSGKQPSVETLVREFVDSWAGGAIDKDGLDALRRFVVSRRDGKPPGPARLLEGLLSTAAPISAAIGGFAADLRGQVRIQDLDSSEASLIKIANQYEEARSTGDAERAADCRRAVLHSKGRLAFLLARPNLSEAKRTEKTELQEWFRVWLEAPSLFESWVDLRRQNSSK